MSAPNTVILNAAQQIPGWLTEPQAEAVYEAWARNPHVQPAFRGIIDDASDATMLEWESRGFSYVFTAASSDYGAPPALYSTPSTAQLMSGRQGCLGLYLHEVCSYYAAVNGWNWQAAAETVNLDLVNDYVAVARFHGKLVYWSEPAQGWSSLMAILGDFMADEWKGVVVPLFATNFPANLAQAIAGAEQAATGGVLGESVQSWNFRDAGLVPKQATTLALCQRGLATTPKATVFQIEGRQDDMQPASPFMAGVNQFVASL